MKKLIDKLYDIPAGLLLIGYACSFWCIIVILILLLSGCHSITGKYDSYRHEVNAIKGAYDVGAMTRSEANDRLKQAYISRKEIGRYGK